jgi:hypothetical protein
MFKSGKAACTHWRGSATRDGLSRKPRQVSYLVKCAVQVGFEILPVKHIHYFVRILKAEAHKRDPTQA